MTYEEFRDGILLMDPNAQNKEIVEAFSDGDTDRNKKLSWEEFEALFKMA